MSRECLARRSDELDARVAQREGEGALDLLRVGVVRRDAVAHQAAGDRQPVLDSCVEAAVAEVLAIFDVSAAVTRTRESGKPS